MPVIEIEYRKANTPVHKLHPLTKIIFEVAVFIIAASFNDPLYLGILILGIVGVIVLARIPARTFRYMRFVAFIVLFLIFTQGIWFTSFGDFGGIEGAFQWHTLFHLWPGWLPGGPRIPFVLEGAIYGFSLGLRMVAISLAFPILVITTHPSDLVTWLAQVRIGSWRIPYNFIFVLTSALRYVPSVSREFDQTIDAQRSRGVEFESYNIFNQMRNALPLFVPVLISSLVRAQDLTIALETRAFGAQTERTFMRKVERRPVDLLISVVFILLAIIAVVAVQRYGAGLLPYTPDRGI